MCLPEAGRASGRKNDNNRSGKNAGPRRCRKIPDSGLQNSAFFRASLDYECLLDTQLRQQRWFIHLFCERKPSQILKGLEVAAEAGERRR